MPRTVESVLIVAVNWIGDTIMALPAVQAFRAAHPHAHITVMAKPGILPLWEAHVVPDSRIEFLSGTHGTWQTIQLLRSSGPYDRVFILPNSFRSALIPWLAGVRPRIGLAGHGRRWLLTQPVDPMPGPERPHQSVEYAHLLLGANRPTSLPAPQLSVSHAETQEIDSLVCDLPRPLIGLIPGAARGPSKQWPRERFIETGQRLSHDDSMGIVVIGSSAERPLCEEIARDIGVGARAIAGRTNLQQWLALLASCDVVVANDSGAMHVAAALGVGVVAIFGITDPVQTGPLGNRVVILQKSTERNRDIPRISEAATAALAAVQPDEVCVAIHQLLVQKGSAV